MPNLLASSVVKKTWRGLFPSKLKLLKSITRILISELTAKADEIRVNATTAKKWEVTNQLQPIVATLEALKTNQQLTPREKELVIDLLSDINHFKTMFSNTDDASVHASLQSMI